MNKMLKSYLWQTFYRSNHPKYLQYFNVWCDNLTDSQIYYFQKDLIKFNKN